MARIAEEEALREKEKGEKTYLVGVTVNLINNIIYLKLKEQRKKPIKKRVSSEFHLNYSFHKMFLSERARKTREEYDRKYAEGKYLGKIHGTKVTDISNCV